jgi:hypothetical protein
LNQKQMVVREQMFDEPTGEPQVTEAPLSPHDMLRRVLHDQQHPTATPIVSTPQAVRSPEAVYSIAQLIPDTKFPMPTKPVQEAVVQPSTVEQATPAFSVEAYLAPPDLLPGMCKSSTVVVEEDE